MNRVNLREFSYARTVEFGVHEAFRQTSTLLRLVEQSLLKYLVTPTIAHDSATAHTKGIYLPFQAAD